VIDSTDQKVAAKSGLFPFYHEYDSQLMETDQDMTEEEKETTAQDWQDCKYMIEYRRNLGWDVKAKRGMKIYNVLQTFTPQDEVSNIFLGYSRTMIDKGIEQMTEGEPDFDFEPFGPSDHLKTIVWKHLIKMILSQCDYKVHQKTFFRDYFVMGSAVFEIFIDYPQRTIRVPNADWPGGFEPVVVEDKRRPKVGVRAINPINCWRNPNIDTPTHVPSCLKKRVITWNQFAQEFGRCKDVNGVSRYENLRKVALGTHVCLYYYQDEIRDIYRIYAKSFGTQSDGRPTNIPIESGLGIRIFDQPLKIHEEKVNGIVTRCTGLNIPGICSLRWGTFFDAYDKNYDGNHSVYGMGLPQRIEGEDTALQTMFNMYLDQERWAGTAVLNYKGNNADSYIDSDANRFYGAEVIDGEITPMPLGISRPNSFEMVQEVIDKNTIPATGINHQQLIGDTSKTAFEFAQRIKAANRGAEERLSGLEAEVFKPVGSLLLANSLTVLTTNEYEDMTEEQVKAARDAIKSGTKTLHDYQDLNGKNPKRRNLVYIPMKGEKIRENFKITKKRKLDYNAPYKGAYSTNTLIPDKSMNVSTSYVPFVEEYVYPTEYIESGLMPDCIVDSKRMLGDMKAQDVQNWQAATNFLLQLMTVAGYKGVDLDKMAAGTLEFAGIDPKTILTSDAGGSDILAKIKSSIQALQPSPQSNAVPTPVAPQADAGAANPLGGGQQQPQAALAAAATGGL
jgi:hypothetical protein